MEPSKRIYFVSTMSNLTDDEFNAHYARKLRKSNADYPTCHYIIGDTPSDHVALEFLVKCGISPERITIYSRDGPSVNRFYCKTATIADDIRRADKMTSLSTHDIAWVRPGAKDSDPEKNINRRRQRFHAAQKVKTQGRPLMTIYAPGMLH